MTFKYRDYRKGGTQETLRLSGEEFVGRFLQHVVPHGFRRIRQYGLFCGGKQELIDQLREQMSQRSRAVLETLLKWEATQPATPWEGPPCPDCGQPMSMGAPFAPNRIDSS